MILLSSKVITRQGNSNIEALSSKQIRNPNVRNYKHFGRLNFENLILFRVQDLDI